MTKQQLNIVRKDDDDTTTTGSTSTQDDGQGTQQSGDGSGDDGGNDSGSLEPPASTSGDTSGQDSGRMFSQQDVTRMMAREKQQGRNAAFNELGIDPNDTATMSLIKTILTAQKQNEEPPVAPSAELVEAERRADIAEAKAEAMMLGANHQYVDDIVTLAIAKLDTAGETDFKAILESIKTKYPVWFGSKEEDDKPGHKGTGSSLPSYSGNNKGGSGEMSLGQRLAAAKKPTRAAKSYWNN